MPKSHSSTNPGLDKPSPTASTATKRLVQEMASYAQAPNRSVVQHLGPTSDTDLLRWEAVLKGPAQSPYAGGLWLLSLEIPTNYPLSPPRVVFRTPICHPNVNFATGDICLTLLTTEHWSPLYTLGATLAAVQQLLLDPVADSPLNVDVANLYRLGDTVAAEGLVRFWTAERRWRGEGEGGWISGVVRGQTAKLEK